MRRRFSSIILFEIKMVEILNNFIYFFTEGNPKPNAPIIRGNRNILFVCLFIIKIKIKQDKLTTRKLIYIGNKG
jgi:hypothetical protein